LRSELNETLACMKLCRTDDKSMHQTRDITLRNEESQELSSVSNFLGHFSESRIDEGYFESDFGFGGELPFPKHGTYRDHDKTVTRQA
jgi:hypothetical protein